MDIIVLDIRMGVSAVYAIAGAMLPVLAFMRGRLTLGGVALSVLVAVGTVALSIVGAREVRKNGTFLKFGLFGWYVVPHLSWAVGLAAGVLAAYASLPIQ